VREAVLGLPAGERQGQIENRWPGKRLRREVLAPDDAFVGCEHGRRTGRDVRREVSPFVCRRRHLRQRPGGEPPRALDEDRGRPAPGRFECEAVLGMGGDRPELAPALYCVRAAVAQFDKPVPLSRRAQPVDKPNELVDVAALDSGENRFRHGHQYSVGRRALSATRFGDVRA
jgi:hypothetical protein